MQKAFHNLVPSDARRYLKYLQTPEDVPDVPPETSGRTSSTSRPGAAATARKNVGQNTVSPAQRRV
jgi:hypothetical protein